MAIFARDIGVVVWTLAYSAAVLGLAVVVVLGTPTPARPAAAHQVMPPTPSAQSRPDGTRLPG